MGHHQIVFETYGFPHFPNFTSHFSVWVAVGIQFLHESIDGTAVVDT